MFVVVFLCAAIVIGLGAAFAIILAKKWGIVEYMQTHGTPFVHALASCDFCLSWWMSLAISVTAAAVSGAWWVIPAAVCSTMISRAML